MAEVVSSGSTVAFARRRPAALLRRLIAWYHGYRETGASPGQHRGLPSPHLTLIVTLDDPLVVAAHPDRRTQAGRYDTLVAGLHTVPTLITHDGRQSGIQLGLTPLGARALLGVPAGELMGIDVDAADVLGPLAHRLREQILEADGWAERFAVLDRVLLTRARTEVALPAEVAHTWRRLLVSDGAAAVSELARETGWSSRHLRQRFRAELGLGPKEAARVVRFDRARQHPSHAC